MSKKSFSFYLGFAAGLVLFVGLVYLLFHLYFNIAGTQPWPISLLTAIVSVAGAASVGARVVKEKAAEDSRVKRYEKVEKELREHPDKPQLAWDLARTKLENYLDRNLSQVGHIFALTVGVMLCGFAIVVSGLIMAATDPARLPISIVASASGILVSFIGGSFLLVYKSILSQARDYVVVLERINAVGMAVQIIAGIPDESAELKQATTAELAGKLLHLYSVK